MCIGIYTLLCICILHTCIEIPAIQFFQSIHRYSLCQTVLGPDQGTFLHAVTQSKKHHQLFSYATASHWVGLGRMLEFGSLPACLYLKQHVLSHLFFLPDLLLLAGQAGSNCTWECFYWLPPIRQLHRGVFIGCRKYSISFDSCNTPSAGLLLKTAQNFQLMRNVPHSPVFSSDRWKCAEQQWDFELNLRGCFRASHLGSWQSKGGEWLALHMLFDWSSHLPHSIVRFHGRGLMSSGTHVPWSEHHSLSKYLFLCRLIQLLRSSRALLKYHNHVRLNYQG